MLDATHEAVTRPPLPRAIFAIAALLIVLELTTGTRYGPFRDELYYLACAERLSWGYVDHPPLSIAVLAASRLLFGDSQFGMRIVPAFVGGANVLVAGAIARQLGGQGFAMVFAALSVAVAPLYLALAGFYSMNPIDVLAWASATLILARLLASQEPRSWQWLGLVVGLGLLNKLSMAFFVLGLCVAVLVVPALRRQLRRREPWLGLGLALLVFTPHLLWQIEHGFPTLEFMHNASAHKNVRLSPLELLLAQVELIHPLNLPLWVGGLLWLASSAQARRFRALAVIWAVVFAVLAVQGAKGYYLGPSFMLLLPAGAVACEGWLTQRALRWPRVVLPALLTVGGLALAPLVIPVLSVEGFIAYQAALGLEPRQAERTKLGPLPQHFADRFGWMELTESVARAIASIPLNERGRVLLATSNYGQASALNYFGRPYRLPRAVSTHNNYFLWGPATTQPSVVVVVGASLSELRALFEVCTPQARTSSPYAMPFESEAPIVICRKPRLPFEAIWRRSKRYI